MERLEWAKLGLRPLFFPAVGWVLGCWFGLDLPVDFRFLLLAGTLLLGISFLAASKPGSHLALLVAAALSGAGLARFEGTSQVPADLPPRASVHLEGQVERVDRFGEGVRLHLAVARQVEAAERPARFRALLSSSNVPEPLRSHLAPGQRVLVPATLVALEPPANPGERESFEHLRRRGVAFKGSFDGETLVVLSSPPPFRRWLDQTRAELTAAVDRLDAPPEAKRLFLALSAGQRAELGEAMEEDFSRSGLAHVLSVSGLHVAALAVATLALARWLLSALLSRRLGRILDVRRLAGPLSLPLLWGYVAFTGFEPPAVRSALMASAVLASLALWRSVDALNSLALAALLTAAFEPSAVASLSAQLSFLAVASLLVLHPALRAALPIPPPSPGTEMGWRLRGQRLRESALQLLCAGIAVTLAGLPLLANHFHRVSLVGLLSNLLCLPLCGALAAVAAGAAGLFVLSPALAAPWLFVGVQLSRLLVWAAQLFAGLPGGSVWAPELSAGLSLSFFFGLLAFALAAGRWRWLSLAAPAALLAALLPDLPRGSLEVTFLSVGHGDAIVIRTSAGTALVDAGGVPSGTDTGKRFVVPFLRRHGIERLRLAALSHPHPDHGLGLVSTLREVPTEHLWLAAGTAEGELSEAVRAAAATATVSEVGLGAPAFELGGARLEVLGPPPDNLLLEGVNDRSLVLALRHGQVSFLLTGDIEAAGEEALVEHARGPLQRPFTVVKAPHHGSSTSSTPALVEATRPHHVVFCVGRHSRFRFPAAEVVDRWEKVGAHCHRTDVQGAIRFVSDGESVTVQPFRAGA